MTTMWVSTFNAPKMTDHRSSHRYASRLGPPTAKERVEFAPFAAMGDRELERARPPAHLRERVRDELYRRGLI